MTDAFGEELRRWRERGGLSLADLANRVHYSKSHLSNVELGRKHGTIELAERCDAALQANGHLIGVMHAHLEPTHPGRTAKPAQLPTGIGYFVGRMTALARLDSLLETANPNETVPIVAIDGMPGIGKTALAIRWAHEHASNFPDGVLYADLHGHSAEGQPTAPEEVLEQFLRALGVPSGAIPSSSTARSALYRSLLDGRRILVVLDNAATSDQARPLLPGSAGSVVIVTSRSRLSGLAVREGAVHLILQPLRRLEAMSLLKNLLGSDRVDAEPDAATLVAERCAFLPLALRIAAERMASYPCTALAELAKSLGDETDRLNVLAIDDEASALRTVFAWSYRALPTESARMFRLMSAHPGPDIIPPAAAALASVSTDEAARILNHLASSHLLGEHEPGRFRLPPLLNTYAAERLRAEEPRSAGAQALNRVVTWYLRMASAAGIAINPHRRHLKLPEPDRDLTTPMPADRAGALVWCDAELQNLVAAVHAAANAQLDTIAWQLPLALGAYFDLRKAWEPWIETHHLGLLAARRQGVRVAEAWLLTNLATAYCDLRRLDESRDLLEESLAIQRELGDQRGEASTLLQLGRTFTALKWFDKALAQYRAALQVLPNVEDHHGEAIALAGVADVYCAAGQHQLAREPAETALAIFRGLRDRRGEGTALHSRAVIYHAMGYLDQAVAEFNHALDALRDADDQWQTAIALTYRGRTQHELGQPDAANSSESDSLAIFEKVGDPRAADLRARLQGTNASPSLPTDQAC